MTERYAAIDGDVVDFIGSMELALDYSTDELVSYLRREGHREPEILAAVREWQRTRFSAGPDGWTRFTLNDEGRHVVGNLQWAVR